jgi:hypothetical protein
LRAVEIVRGEVVGPGNLQYSLQGSVAPYLPEFRNKSIDCDSFVTFSLVERTTGSVDCTGLSPDFEMSKRSINGSWFCAGKETAQTTDTSVLLAQLSISVGSSLELDLVLYSRNAARCEASLTLTGGNAVTTPCVPLPQLNISWPAIPDEPPPPSDAWIAGLVLGVLVVLGLIVLGVVIALRKRSGASRLYMVEHLRSGQSEESSFDSDAAPAPPTAVESTASLGSTRTAEPSAVYRPVSKRPPNIPNALEEPDELRYEDFL